MHLVPDPERVLRQVHGRLAGFSQVAGRRRPGWTYLMKRMFTG
jgi:hypothetical protein